MSDEKKAAAIDRLIEIISHARQRPEMYFLPIGPVALIHWLHGLRTGINAWAGVIWYHDHRRAALESRGLEVRAAAWEDDELERRGLTPREIVDELLSIEIEMWQSHRMSCLP